MNICQNLRGMAMYAKDAEAPQKIETRHLLQLLHTKSDGLNKTIPTGQLSNEREGIIGVPEAVRDLRCRGLCMQREHRQLRGACLQ